MLSESLYNSLFAITNSPKLLNTKSLKLMLFFSLVMQSTTRSKSNATQQTLLRHSFVAH